MVSKMKVGDLVRWKPQNDFGTIIEIQTICLATNQFKYKIMWHVDIDANDGHDGTWYGDEDFGLEGNIGII